MPLKTFDIHDARKYYRQAEFTYAHKLLTSEGAAYRALATTASTSAEFHDKLRALHRRIESLHKEAQEKKVAALFARKSREIAKIADNRIKQGHSPEQVLHYLQLQFAIPLKRLAPKPRSTSSTFIASAVIAGSLAAAGIPAVGNRLEPELKLPKPSARKVFTLKTVDVLTKRAEKHIAQLRSTGVLSPEDEISLVVQDPVDREPLIEINPLQKRRAASLIKPFIMLAAYHKLAQGVPASHNLERDIRKMIAESDNEASKRVLYYVGGPNEAQRIVRAHGFRGTDVVQYIPHNGRAYRNRTTTSDLNAFLAKVHSRQLISSEYSRRMHEHLNAYATSRLGAIEGPDLQLAGKTGFVRGVQGEATQVTINGHTYNFVAIVEKPNMSRSEYEVTWRDNAIAAIKSIFWHVKDGVVSHLQFKARLKPKIR